MDDYLRGLAFLHEKGIMHRDISPNNLAVTSFEQPRGLIIDLDAATKDPESEDHVSHAIILRLKVSTKPMAFAIR